MTTRAPRFERLRVDHAPAVLTFELENRAWFAAAVSDRGDEFFAGFDAQFERALADQEAGTCAFFVLVGDDGAVLGRFNLYDTDGDSGRVGYRVAERVAGQGVATAAVRELCAVAAQLGLSTLTAATAEGNVASQRVLIKAGFVADGPADPADVGGKSGLRFRRALPR